MSITHFFRKAFGFKSAQGIAAEGTISTLHKQNISMHTALPVAQIVLAIRSRLPDVEIEQYESLSQGQKALWDASIYLEHHRLESAAKICEEAYGDPSTPGDEWVTLLIDAIKSAANFPGTDSASFKASIENFLNRS